jgi:signal transduction histidine kinase/CheY-like chemotaxis protein
MAMFDSEMRYIAVSDMWMKSRSHGRPEAGRDGHIGKCHYDVAPEDRDVWGHLHARGLAGETLSKSEDCFVHADGTTSWLKWTIQPWFHREGAIGGIFIVWEFIDELVSSREKALESARAKSNFLATISHEIRTPLNGILGMTELLAETALNAEQRRYLGYAQQSAGNLLTLVGDVLDFSKIDSGRVELRHDDFDLPQLLTEITSSFGILAEKKGVLLTASVAADVPHRVVGDCDRLRQILVNLIGNAVKFTPKGDVIVAAKRVPGTSPDSAYGSTKGSAKGSVNGSLVRIEVSDTGVGMAPGALGRLFQPFTQEDSSTSRRFGGTGLGLAITKRLVELMGGHVGAASVQGFGTTFWVELPLAVAEAPEPILRLEPTAGRPLPAPAFQEEAPWLPGTRVLVAEDNEVNAFLIRRMLDLMGLSHVLVEHGEDVLRVLESETFDLLLLDCQMPVLDGYETARRVRALETTRPHQARLPIVAVTANALTGERDKCQQAGMDDYLAKPMSPDALRTILARWLPSGRGSHSLTAHVTGETATA